MARIPHATAQPVPQARNVVLVHGLFADGSCWTEVIPRLQAAGLNVTSVQNPLTTLEEAVVSAQRVLARHGPTQAQRSTLVAVQRHCTPVRLSRGGCSFQFGRASAPIIVGPERSAVVIASW
jgi:hypothetical protein